jgi:Secretion system C-terminal sorting domain
MKTNYTIIFRASALLLFLIGTLNATLTTAQTGGATFEAGPNMMRGKIFPTSTLLNDGKVISFSGRETNFISCSYSDLYNPVTNTFSEATMNMPHDASATVKLSDGRFLLMGGGENLGIAPGYATTEIYNPSTGIFETKASMTMARMQHTGVQLADGKVLVVGAWYNTNGATYGELYDINLDTFTPTGAMNDPRSQPNVFPTADGGAIITGGWPSYGGAVKTSVEYYSAATNSFSLQSSQLIPSDPDWIPLSTYTRPMDDCKMNDGSYLMMAYRNVTTLEYALLKFDPVTKLFTKINTLSPLVDAFSDGGFGDFVLNKADNFVYLIGFDAGLDPQQVSVVTVDLTSGLVYHPNSTFTLPPQEYFYASYTFMPASGKIMVMGVNSSNSSYFNGTSKTYILTPQITIGTREIDENTIDLTCYPNPANNELNLRLNSKEAEKLSVEVFDIAGQLILEETKFSTKGIQTWNLNTSSLPNGIYLLRLLSAKKNYTQSFTIAK